MTELLPWMGAVMLVVLGLATVMSGLPIWTLLIGVSSLFAALAVASGVAQWEHLGAVGVRVVGVLDNDLLQALPLYMLVGVLLQYLPLGQALLAALGRAATPTGAGPAVAVLGVGAVIAPMNGSVASSSAMLSRLVQPGLATLAAPRALALVAAAGTIGVVVPPSLVLLLLGDAMMRAHTEASHWAGWLDPTGNIINTQDVLHAALLPAVAIGGLWLLWVLVGYRAQAAQAAVPCTRRQGVMAGLTVAAVAALLSGVFAGYFFAVEAAAAGAVLLGVYALASRSLTAPQWRAVVWESMGLSGAVLALLVGATVFSMVFRLWGTDVVLAQGFQRSGTSPQAAAAVLLLVVALCAWVLDAFEMIFVVVPVLAPPLVFLLQDAQQAAVLLLLVLQLSFLLPPLGYAVMMARTHIGRHTVSTGTLLRHLLPFLGAQTLVIAAVFAFPALVHQLDKPVEPTTTLSDDEVVRQMMEMSAPPEDAERKP